MEPGLAGVTIPDEVLDWAGRHGLDLDETAAAEGLSVLGCREQILAHLPADILAAYGLDDIC